MPSTLRTITMGTFDVPHVGHALFLEKCSALTDDLVVGVSSDDFVERYKGFRPLFSERERVSFIERLGYNAIVTDGVLDERLLNMGFNHIIIGSDWLRKDYLPQIGASPELLERYKISLSYIPYTDGISATEIKKRVGRREVEKQLLLAEAAKAPSDEVIDFLKKDLESR